MKGIKVLIVPATVVWFMVCLRWAAMPGVCGCAANTDAPSRMSSIAYTLGPRAVGSRANTASLAPTGSVRDVQAVPDARVVRFTKNRPEPAMDDGMARYVASLKTFLAAHPGSSLAITGHTDADGDAALNRRLSLDRAERVKVWLVDHGIPAGSVRTSGAGAEGAIADNITSKGKALNRRVEITPTSGN